MFVRLLMSRDFCAVLCGGSAELEPGDELNSMCVCSSRDACTQVVRRSCGAGARGQDHRGGAQGRVCALCGVLAHENQVRFQCSCCCATNLLHISGLRSACEKVTGCERIV